MDKWSMITYLVLWGTIIVQDLAIRDLRKRIENEQNGQNTGEKVGLKKGINDEV